MQRRCKQAESEALVSAAAALSIALSRGKRQEEIEILAAFFTTLGDSLELLAVRAPE